MLSLQKQETLHNEFAGVQYRKCRRASPKDSRTCKSHSIAMNRHFQASVTYDIAQDEILAGESWGSPQYMAREILTSNVDAQFLIRPNVFVDPEGEAVHVVRLLRSVADCPEKEEGLKRAFPVYASENRNISKVHAPNEEVSAILDRFWDAAMEEYNKLFGSTHSNTEPLRTKNHEALTQKKMKDMVHLDIADKRREKAETAAVEAKEVEERQRTEDLAMEELEAERRRVKALEIEAQENGAAGKSSKETLVSKDATRSESNGSKPITASTTKRSHIWGAFIHRLQGKRPHKSTPPNVDGAESNDTTRVNSIASMDSLPSEPSANSTLKPVVIETSITDVDGTSEEREIFYEAEEQQKEPTIEETEVSEEYEQAEKDLEERSVEESETGTIKVHDETSSMKSETTFVEEVEAKPQEKPKLAIRIENESEDGSVCEALRRMRFAKDGSFEAYVSVDETQEQSYRP